VSEDPFDRRPEAQNAAFGKHRFTVHFHQNQMGRGAGADMRKARIAVFG
jgi:hypothetical protein